MKLIIKEARKIDAAWVRLQEKPISELDLLHQQYKCRIQTIGRFGTFMLIKEAKTEE